MIDPTVPPMDEDEAAAVLGVDKSASGEEIRAAFRKKALELHPDVAPAGGGPDPDLAYYTRARDALLGADSRLPWLK